VIDEAKPARVAPDTCTTIEQGFKVYIRTIWLCLKAESRLLTDQESCAKTFLGQIDHVRTKSGVAGVSLKGAASDTVAAKAQLEDEPGNQ
jgi:hypothetical protein